MNTSAKLTSSRALLALIGLGLIARLLFFFVGAERYFGAGFNLVESDTHSSIANLIETGTYTLDPRLEYGYFARMPGYAFFVGIFYLLFDGDKSQIYPTIAWVHIVLDLLTLFLFYRTAAALFKNRVYALWAGLLYATYPFIIVWTPTAFSEPVSIFFMVLALHSYAHVQGSLRWFSIAACVGVATLVRPQLALLLPLFGLLLLYEHYRSFPTLLKMGIVYSLGALLTYGLWPIRNYVNHDKLILSQDLRGFSNWSEDVINFMRLIHAVKENWQPQFGQILRNETVSVPEVLCRNPADSLLFVETTQLAQTCSFGFSQWQTMGYWKAPIPFGEQGCTQEVAQNFEILRQRVIEQYPYDYYIGVPLQNLRKAFFKIDIENTSRSGILVSLLFLFRSALLITGIVGMVLWLRSSSLVHQPIAWLMLAYFISWYLLLCGGTAVQMRNMEMRYLLPADILMLFPAAYVLALLFQRLTIFQKLA